MSEISFINGTEFVGTPSKSSLEHYPKFVRKAIMWLGTEKKRNIFLYLFDDDNLKSIFSKSLNKLSEKENISDEIRFIFFFDNGKCIERGATNCNALTLSKFMFYFKKSEAVKINFPALGNDSCQIYLIRN